MGDLVDVVERGPHTGPFQVIPKNSRQAPEWLNARVAAWLKREEGWTEELYGFALLRELGGILDHYGTIVVAGKKCLVTEPYELGFERVLQLVEFCRRFDCDCWISGSATHNPGRCLRVVISDKAEK